MSDTPISATATEPDPAAAYTILCPLGALLVYFPEDGGVVVQIKHGSPDAIDYVNDALLKHTGRMGQSLSLSALEPIELEQFFDGSEDYVSVIPPFDALLDGNEGVAQAGSEASMDSACTPFVNRFKHLEQLRAARKGV